MATPAWPSYSGRTGIMSCSCCTTCSTQLQLKELRPQTLPTWAPQKRPVRAQSLSVKQFCLMSAAALMRFAQVGRPMSAGAPIIPVAPQPKLNTPSCTVKNALPQLYPNNTTKVKFSIRNSSSLKCYLSTDSPACFHFYPDVTCTSLFVINYL